MGRVYEKLMLFKNRYPHTLTSRLYAHATVAENSLADKEEVLYASCGFDELFRTIIFVVTDKRVLVARKKLVYGYYCTSIDKEKICQINTSKGMFLTNVSIRTLTETFGSVNLFDDEAADDIKRSIASNTTNRNNSTSEVSCKEPVRVPASRSKPALLERQINNCFELDKLYRKRYYASSDPEEKEKLKIKILENIQLYYDLTGETPLKQEKPIVRRLG